MVVLLDHVERKSVDLLLESLEFSPFLIRDFRFLRLLDKLGVFQFFADQRLFIFFVFVLFFFDSCFLIFDFLRKTRSELIHIVVFSIS